MQVSSRRWSPPSGVLGRIVDEVRQRLAAIPPAERRAFERAAATAPAPPPFAPALRWPSVAIIAEVKRRSPSKGSINEALTAAAQAEAYARGGAAAISILTEPRHFGGSLGDLEEARRTVTLPLLRKDFLLDELQLFEARAAGASAVLLIVRALRPQVLRALSALARELTLETLVEVRTPEELDVALHIGAHVIGVNSRDLETLAVEASVLERLVPLVPRDRLAVAESGIADVGDVRRVAAIGCDAVLVGSSLSSSLDPAAAVRALSGVARQERPDAR